MAPRASWKGNLRLSLITIPIRMYNAVSSTARVSLNQLHKDCHQRLKQKMTCPKHGDVERDDIVKGYEYEKDTYVVIPESDLEAVRLETTKMIEIVQFVDESELDPIYLDSPYYVAPDGPVAEEAFRVVHEAMRKTKKIGIGRVVLSNREQAVAMRVLDKGILLTTLRLQAEVRAAAPYFEEIKEAEIPKAQTQLAEQLIKTITEPFDISRFSDRYQDALLDVIKTRIEGNEPIKVQEVEAGKVINFMEALKKSIAGAPKAKKKPPAASIKKAAAPAKAKKKAGA